MQLRLRHRPQRVGGMGWRVLTSTTERIAHGLSRCRRIETSVNPRCVSVISLHTELCQWTKTRSMRLMLPGGPSPRPSVSPASTDRFGQPAPRRRRPSALNFAARFSPGCDAVDGEVGRHREARPGPGRCRSRACRPGCASAARWRRPRGRSASASAAGRRSIQP